MGWWDDFAKTIATDLGPLISLFGEEPTKQFLSESTLPEDIIIFAMAPIGILTAVVSVIRVCGSPSLRAFVGRAQEGEGNAEVELCSSTSRNVGELYNNGGVARVFGIPRLLEIMFDPEAPQEEFYRSGVRPPTAGIHWPRDYFNGLDKRSEWAEKNKHKHKRKDVEDGKSDEDEDFAPKPNLSLNVGIKPRKRPWFVAAAILGIVLQSGVLIWAGFSRYTFHFIQANSSADYAVPMTVAGTIIVCCGVGLSAFLVDQSTEERRFTRDKNLTKYQSQMYWIQPGNQTIGDQAFDPFAFSENTRLLEYVTSWKTKRLDEATKKRMESFVWVAVASSMFGFVLQFLGLRACHSSVSVAQLGVMLVMSMIRAGLRTRRLKENENLMRENPDAFAGHELDWLALRLGEDGDSQRKWQIAYVGTDYSKEASFFSHRNKLCLCIDKEYQLVGFRERDAAAEEAGLNYTPEGWTREFRSMKVGLPPHEAVKTFLYRCRLAHMTSNWEDNLLPLRKTATGLAKAINSTADFIFATLSKSDDWAEAHTILWPIKCKLLGQRECEDDVMEIFITLKRSTLGGTISSNWEVDQHELESVLGLQTWTLKDWEGAKSHRENSGIRILWKFPHGSKHEILSLDYDIWRNSRQPGVQEHSVSPPWSNDKSSSETGSPQTRVRTGWQNIAKEDYDGTKIRVLAVPTSLSLVKLCAQEIYSLFFLAIIRITRSTIPFNDSRGIETEQSMISRIQSIFGESKLGSAEDALTCIIPALRLQKKMPTALHVIVVDKSDEEQAIIEEVLKKEVSPGTTLTNSCKSDNVEARSKLAKRLLDEKTIDINSKGDNNQTVLHRALDNEKN